MRTKMVATITVTLDHADDKRITKKSVKAGIEEALNSYPYYINEYATLEKVRVRALDFD